MKHNAKLNTQYNHLKYFTYWFSWFVRGHGHGRQGMLFAGSPYSPGLHSGTSGTQRPNHLAPVSLRLYPGAQSCDITKPLWEKRYTSCKEKSDLHSASKSLAMYLNIGNNIQIFFRSYVNNRNWDESWTGYFQN